MGKRNVELKKQLEDELFSNPKCQTCGNHMNKAILQIVGTSCWNCSKSMKMALVIIAGTYFGPESFAKEQLDLARLKGVIIQEQFSKTTKLKYFANTCPSCKNFIGEFFIHEYLYMSGEDIEAGFFCTKCLGNVNMVHS